MNLVKFSALALVFLAANRYAQADPSPFNGGSYHRMTPDPHTPDNHGAQPHGPHLRSVGVAPEIDPNLALSGLALLAGTLVVLGSSRKRTAIL